MSPVTSISNPFVLTMIFVVVLLILVIKSLSAVLLNAARNSRAERQKAGSERSANRPGKNIAAEGVAAVAVPLVNGVSDTAFYAIISVIGLEILVILYLLHNINILQKEADRDMSRDHGRVRESDNKLPLSWRYGLYAMTVFAVIGLWRFHVSQSAPPSGEEYANVEQAANSVDENTVKLLTSPADLAAGKAVFQTICFACHGMNGEGSVGPNLTDNYWLHGGSIQDIFKTIKYGYPDKGMKSWKDDYTPVQIAQISSYVKSLAGTNPPNAKAPQGDLAK